MLANLAGDGHSRMGTSRHRPGSGAGYLRKLARRHDQRFHCDATACGADLPRNTDLTACERSVRCLRARLSPAARLTQDAVPGADSLREDRYDTQVE